jgi:hypothetical protein
MFSGPLPSNRSPSVARVRLAGMHLPGRCLAMGIHITVLFHVSTPAICVVSTINLTTTVHLDLTADSSKQLCLNIFVLSSVQ